MNSDNAMAILKFWFGENYTRWPEKDTTRNWFMGGPEFDQAIEAEFGGLIEEMLTNDQPTPVSSEELVASIIVLDQFTRNCFRGTARAFSGDQKALTLAKYAVKQDYYKKLPAQQKIFITMPYEHSENLDDQLVCLSLFEKMIAYYPQPIASKVEGFQQYAKDHYLIIKQFGRFPHRNAVLDRDSTPEELQYLTNGKTFGQ